MDHPKNNQSHIPDTATVTELLEKFNESDGSPRQFLLNLLAAHCYLAQADEGAVLRVSDNKDVDVIAIYPPLKENAPAPEWLKQSANYAHEALSSETAFVRPIEGSNQFYSQPAELHVAMIPLRFGDITDAVAVFMIKTGDGATLETSFQRLRVSVGVLGYCEKRPARENWQQSCRRLQRAIETLSAVNRQDKFTGTAMAFCNEVASQWQCERVSLGFLKGRYVQLKAMSHTESFSRKMQIVQDIEAAMEECLDQDVEILSPAPKEAAFVSRSADALSQRYGPLNVISFPLRREAEVVAVLTLERPAQRPFSSEEIETIRLACELCTPRLVNLHESDRWIGAAVVVRTRKLMAGLVGPRHTWAKVVSILCFAAILFLIFAKGQFRAKAPFVLEATYQQVVPAPFDGYIKNVEVEVGDLVEGGKSILAGLDTAELRLQLAAVKAEKAGYLKQSAAAMRDSETAKAQIAQADADKAQAQIELLEYQIGQASLVSPLSGIVVKGDLKREIGAPVKVGDVLFEVCPLEALRAQLMVPEDEIYDIKVGQEGYLATASYPGQRIKLVVERINPIAEVVNQRNIFKVRVQLLETHPWMRPGMVGVAKVSVGKRPYAWIWTRKIINWIRMQLWF